MSTISTTHSAPGAAAAAPAAAEAPPPAPSAGRAARGNAAKAAAAADATAAASLKTLTAAERAPAQPVLQSCKWKMHQTVQEFDTPYMRADLPTHSVPLGTKGRYFGEPAVVVGYDASLPSNYDEAGDKCLLTLAWEGGRVRVPKTMFLDETGEMWVAPAAAGEAKRKHEGDEKGAASAAASSVSASAAASSVAAAKKQKVVTAANKDPTGVAVVLFCVMNATLHVLGFQEDRHRWPDGVQERWDKLFLRNPTGRGDFPSSPFQLYTDVPEDGLNVPGKVFEDGMSQRWTRRDCLRLMLVHMLGKGWCPVCVADHFELSDAPFCVFVQQMKAKTSAIDAPFWVEHVCDQLTDETWDKFSGMIKANQPEDDWHFITVPAENCRGKDMSTPERCKDEVARAMREEAGLSSVPSASSVVKCTTGKYKTSAHALICKDPEPLLSVSRETLTARQDIFPWRCPHNWPGVRDKTFKKAFEGKIKAYRETCKPRWVPEQDFASVFDNKSQAAIAAVYDEVKARVHSV